MATGGVLISSSNLLMWLELRQFSCRLPSPSLLLKSPLLHFLFKWFLTISKEQNECSLIAQQRCQTHHPHFTHQLRRHRGGGSDELSNVQSCWSPSQPLNLLAMKLAPQRPRYLAQVSTYVLVEMCCVQFYTLPTFTPGNYLTTSPLPASLKSFGKRHRHKGFSVLACLLGTITGTISLLKNCTLSVSYLHFSHLT